MFDYHAAKPCFHPPEPLPAACTPTGATDGFDVPATEPPVRSGFPVYLVEQERRLRIATARVLMQAGFETRPFIDADDLAAAVPELAPGCVVLDITALGSLAPALRADAGTGPLRFPTILTFSSLETDDAVRAVRLGAADLLQRPVPAEEMIAAVRGAAPKVQDLQQRLAACRARAAIKGLSLRERQVMDCIMKGLSSKEMARTLGISPRTVDMHRRRLHRRLSVGSVAELLALAWSAKVETA